MAEYIKREDVLRHKRKMNGADAIAISAISKKKSKKRKREKNEKGAKALMCVGLQVRKLV